MDFKASSQKSKLIELKDSILIGLEDVEGMICNEFLHDIHAHFIVRSEGEYDDSSHFQYGMPIDRIQIIQQAYKENKTIIIKDIEHWNERVIGMSKRLSSSTNAHLYLTPKGGTGFGWHNDDRDVYIIMQVGSKNFEVQLEDGQIKHYLLKAGDCLYIPYGHKHRAFAVEGEGSVHIGFGVWPDGVTIKSTYKKFPIDYKITL